MIHSQVATEAQWPIEIIIACLCYIHKEDIVLIEPFWFTAISWPSVGIKNGFTRMVQRLQSQYLLTSMLPQKRYLSWELRKEYKHINLLFIYCKKSFPKQMEDHNSFCSANKGLSPNKDYYRLLITHVRTSNHSLIKQYYVIHTILYI